MSTYAVDERDVQFTLFEYLNLGQLTANTAFKEQSEDLYKMIISEALKFAQNEIDPLRANGDKEGCKINNGKVTVPQGYKEAYKAFAQNGFIGMDVSPNYGGQGLPTALFTTVYEFFTGADVPFSMYAGLTRGSAFLIESFGTEELKKLFCEKMYSGEWGGTMCLTEPWAGSAVGDLKSVAKPNGDGTYNIKGSKIFISGGEQDLTDNIIHLLLARVEGDAPGTKGISLFVVPKFWVNPDGSVGEFNDVNCVNIEHKMGIKAQATCSLNFGEAGKCRGFLIGEQSKGMKYMFQMMNEARILCGLQGQAVGAAAYQCAVKYAKDRIQGGQDPIINYPDVRRNLAFGKAWTEGMRALLYKTALYVDLAEKSDDAEQRAKYHDRVELLTPICKAYCSDWGFKVTELAIQVYGGYGYISEYPVEQHMRDVKIASIYEGTNGIQALDLLGRKLPMKGGELFRNFYQEITDICGALESNATLQQDAVTLKKAADSVAQVAMKIMEWGMGGDRTSPMLAATPLLEMVGHVAVAHCLLEQAQIAEKHVSQGSTDAFYKNKIKTTQFFIAQILPNVQARAKSILSGDKSAMEMEF